LGASPPVITMIRSATGRRMADEGFAVACHCATVPAGRGSLEGRSTVWLLKNVLTGKGSTLDCIDLCERPWIDRFRANIKPWRRRVRLHCGPSVSTLPRLKGEFDFIYIDADHRPFCVPCTSNFHQG
jgi:hypothetical protein